MSQRAGMTQKISVSVKKDDLALLRKRAKLAHGGNVSSVIAELIAREREQEHLAQLLELLGGPVTMSESEREAIDREILGVAAPRVSKRRKRSAA